MIDKRELRIGNKVHSPYHNLLFATVDGMTTGPIVMLREVSTYDTFESIEPLPLSPAILESCGFEVLNGIVGQYYLKTDRFLFSFYEDKNDIMIQDMKPVNTLAQGIANLKIEHLHQLQNLVYALTGTELNVNLKDVKV